MVEQVEITIAMSVQHHHQVVTVIMMATTMVRTKVKKQALTMVVTMGADLDAEHMVITPPPPDC